jgi:signal transduction histidine kinase
VDIWSRWRADLARPEVPTSRDETGFQVVAPLVIVAVAQVTDPGSLGEVLLLVPAVLGYVLRVTIPRFPAEAFAVLVIASVMAAVGNDGSLETAFLLTIVMVLYTAWTLGSLTRAVAIAAAAMVAPWLVAEHLAPDSGIAWNPWVMPHVLTFLLGRTLRRQRVLIVQLEAAQLALADQAVAEERRRIARELHDLAGHTLAAVVLHVTGARHVLRRDVAEAEAALRDAEAVGRSSLDQIRSAVAALRADESGTEPALAGTADLPALISDFRRAGLVIDAAIAPDAAHIDGPVGTAVHRIAREALTNVARHAPRNRVAVRLTAVAGEARLVVSDAGAAARPPDDGLHFGLVGMAERARALGGEVDAGPTADGWRVDARLPLPQREPERAR